MPSWARSSLVAIGILAIAVPGAAIAAGGGSIEPHASSPAGAVYEIPLQTARRDAAPRGSGGSGNGKSNSVTPAAGNDSNGGGPGGGGVLPQGSEVKSENGFGSSSQVPGMPTARGVTPAEIAAAIATLAKSGTKHALGVSTPELVQAKPSSTQIPSTGASYLLIAMLALAGIATGIVAGGAVRRGLH